MQLIRTHLGKGVTLVLALVLAVFGLAVPGANEASAQSGNGVSLVTDASTAGSVNGYSVYYYTADGTPYLEDQIELNTIRMPDGSTVPAYCVNIDVYVDKNGAPYDLTDYATQGIPNGQKVQWILAHSYPTISEGELARAAGTSGLTKKGAVS